MAKRRALSVVRSFPVSRPAPIIIRQTRAAPKAKKHRRRSGRSAGSSGRTIMGVAMGGALFGFLEKSFPALPTLPIIGRAGTVALAAHLAAKHMGGGLGHILRDVSLAAAAIAGHELGKDGKISGDELDGDVPQQVRGIASQV